MAFNDAFGWKPIRELAIGILKSDSITWMQTASAGLDNPLFKMVHEKGITITNSDAQAPAIAEYVMAQVMAHFQPTFERVEAQAAKQWMRLPFKEIWGTTWLVIGFGHIGSEVGKRARAFDANVIGVRHSGRPHEHADEMITQDKLGARLGEADVIVLACPLTEATRGMADAEFFAKMKKASTLVNIGRGDLVNEVALIEALKTGTPDMALLDVFQTEPLPEDSPLWVHPRVRATSHTSAFGSGTRARGDDLFIENLKKFLKSEPLKNEIKEIP